jgi:dephospho-CoA kinase
MLIIGLTGGIGTGKSEVSKVLRGLGAEIISADELGHEVYRRGSKGWREVVDEFGKGVLSPSGEVDRSGLGAMVFGDERALARLNAIVHPRIRAMVEERVRALRAQGTEAVVVDAALLLEARWADLSDEIWVIVASEERVVERLQGGRNLEVEAVRARIRSQMSQEERLTYADVVIDNEGTLEELRDRVRAAWRERVPQR